ncbi:MAG: glutamyl-tRNA reductase [Bacteroidetes bacterium GWE2_29_8]|nr:MAG: glutamyl-tRNA reductase [Bacteroidetes bacterium GWE2_29_8]OFY18741.1 MAG: glutamyl-tRNA reductase [Bacteroidetes bacterium GWF2_29_10]
MLGIIGLNHQTALVSLRERLSFNESEINDFFKELKKSKYITESVVLSTCNRTEIYFNIEECCIAGGISIVFKSLLKYKNIEDSKKKNFYEYTDEKAIEHLFNVVSGIDSMLIGEYQIVSQVKQAFNISKQAKFSGKILERLFIKALEVSKIVRSNSNINFGAMSLGYVVVEKCYNLLKNLDDKTLLLIGAGETGEIVIKHFVKKGLKNIYISNRTNSKAIELANKYNGNTIPYDEYENFISKADIIITSTASKNNIISKEDIKETLNSKIFFDLSVPRNINENIIKITNINLYNIDDLKEVIIQTNERKKEKIELSKNIIREEVVKFCEWMSVQNLNPAIKNINIALKYIHHKEIKKLRNKISEENYEKINEFGDILAKRIRKEIISRMKDITEGGKRTEYLKVINDLFLVKK